MRTSFPTTSARTATLSDNSRGRSLASSDAIRSGCVIEWDPRWAHSVELADRRFVDKFGSADDTARDEEVARPPTSPQFLADLECAGAAVVERQRPGR